MIYNTPYINIDISITISTIQWYTASLSGSRVHYRNDGELGNVGRGWGWCSDKVRSQVHDGHQCMRTQCHNAHAQQTPRHSSCTDNERHFIISHQSNSFIYIDETFTDFDLEISTFPSFSPFFSILTIWKKEFFQTETDQNQHFDIFDILNQILTYFDL